MEHQLTIYNTLNRKKELFVPLHAPHVGMYVCGPTVYRDPHLGHARPAITFDLLFRYLTHIGYKVRYVRNITDVGHLEHDAIGNVFHPQLQGQSPCIFQIPGLISCLIETESHASHLITGFLQPHGGHGTIRAATHAKQYTFI